MWITSCCIYQSKSRMTIAWEMCSDGYMYVVGLTFNGELVWVQQLRRLQYDVHWQYKSEQAEAFLSQLGKRWHYRAAMLPSVDNVSPTLSRRWLATSPNRWAIQARTRTHPRTHEYTLWQFRLPMHTHQTHTRTPAHAARTYIHTDAHTRIHARTHAQTRVNVRAHAHIVYLIYNYTI